MKSPFITRKHYEKKCLDYEGALFEYMGEIFNLSMDLDDALEENSRLWAIINKNANKSQKRGKDGRWKK